MKNLKNIFKISVVYIGAVLGAGFASGQEMLSFFAQYGSKGIYGLILTGILFFIIGWAVLELAYVNKSKTFLQFIQPITGKIYGNILEWVIVAFMFICFCAMLAGSGALLEQRFNYPYQAGVIIMAVCCYITFQFGVRGVVAINAIFAPVLLSGFMLIGLYIWIYKTFCAFSNTSLMLNVVTDNWIISSIIYVSYNAITAVVILVTLHTYIKNKIIAFYSSLISGFCLGLLGVCLVITILSNYDKVCNVEIPMLTIVMKYAPAIQYIYILVMISAMFTTAVANGYGIVAKIGSVENKNNKLVIAEFILSAILFSQIGFSNLVGKVYPVFGYIGLYEMILIIFNFIKYKLNNSKR